MKPDPDERLLDALTDESLALAAAAAARRRHRTRANLARMAAGGAAVLLGVGVVRFTEDSSPMKDGSLMAKTSAVPAVDSPSEGSVKAFRVGEPEVLPSDLSEPEKELMASLPDVPMLIVQRPDGGIARVHVFDR